jgi:hypothetical protein
MTFIDVFYDSFLKLESAVMIWKKTRYNYCKLKAKNLYDINPKLLILSISKFRTKL